MRELLEVCADWPDVDIDRLRSRPEWEQARAWGWVMASGELTGTGLAHAKELPKGSSRDDLLGESPGGQSFEGLISGAFLFAERYIGVAGLRDSRSEPGQGARLLSRPRLVSRGGVVVGFG
jgi:hypothetical protein